MVSVYIDGDACPVKNEVIKVAERHSIPVVMVSNSWIRMPASITEIKQVVVEKKPDEADNWIADNIEKADIVITSDIPLASRCLKKEAYAVRPNGSEFTEDNIGMALSSREINNFMREIGEKGSFHSAFSKDDRSNFLSKLETVVQRALKMKK
ncbi:MAG: YaiI/YqxD family protein [Lactobacillus sp.]|jgi:uncharacterized protein YaiI (UPF0178 family)|nr:YaiI/YqxD family protein [Lactobacillus sp.]